MKELKIGELSKLVGLPTKTIRFYEDEGLISPPSRADNGYRLFSYSAVEELKVLKYARDLGLPLTEIKKLMKGCEKGHCSHRPEYLQETIDNYLHLLDEKLAQMSLLKTRLRSLRSTLTDCEHNSEDRYCCDILHQLIITERKEVS